MPRLNSLSSSSSSSSSSSNPPTTTTMSQTTETNKSPSPNEELTTLRRYILQCPDVNPTSRAVQISIRAIDDEIARLERDERLRRKFAESSASSPSATRKTHRRNNSRRSDSGGEEGCDNDDDDGGDDDLVRVEIDGVDSEDGGWEEVTNDSAIPRSSTPVASNSSRAAKPEAGVDGEDGDDDGMDCMEGNGGGDPNAALGVSLARVAIDDLSKAGVVVSTPTAALALVLHAALRSDVLGFRCKGVPEEDGCFQDDNEDGDTKKRKKNKKKRIGGGFAAPVRELPRGQFLPKDWDQYASSRRSCRKTANDDGEMRHRVLLRYGRPGMASTALRVVQHTPPPSQNNDDGDDVEMDTGTTQPSSPTSLNICFGPLGGKPDFDMTFPTDQHINLDGLNAALSTTSIPGGGAGGVRPALYFKSLAQLLATFCRGSATIAGLSLDGCQKGRDDGVGVETSPARADSTTASQSGTLTMPYKQQRTYTAFTTSSSSSSMTDDPLNIPGRRDDPLRVRSGKGDFGDDLNIASGIGSGLQLPGGGMTGNLMGPNHPMFYRGPGFSDDIDDDYMGGGMGMQPRFDPVYPPGVLGGDGDGLGGRRGFAVGRGGGVGMRGRGRGGRGRFGGRGAPNGGDPNNDHQRRPNSFGRNMFT